MTSPSDQQGGATAPNCSVVSQGWLRASHHTLPNLPTRPLSASLQAAGCTSQAGSMRLYQKRKHLCQKHMRAEYVQLEELQGKWRFCFQCGKLEELKLFDGNRR